MTPALDPALAMRYLREMSADLRDGVVLDGRGEILAGAPALAAAARELLAAMGAEREAEGTTAAGSVLASRAADLAVVVVCGPRALRRLTRYDLRRALADLGAPESSTEAAYTVPVALTERLLLAGSSPRTAGESP